MNTFVLTNDLDFPQILAPAGQRGPGVVLLRCEALTCTAACASSSGNGILPDDADNCRGVRFGFPAADAPRPTGHFQAGIYF
jgi:hypothetical protein